jgi:hypothetical protein
MKTPVRNLLMSALLCGTVAVMVQPATAQAVGGATGTATGAVNGATNGAAGSATTPATGAVNGATGAVSGGTPATPGAAMLPQAGAMPQPAPSNRSALLSKHKTHRHASLSGKASVKAGNSVTNASFSGSASHDSSGMSGLPSTNNPALPSKPMVQPNSTSTSNANSKTNQNSTSNNASGATTTNPNGQ